MAKIKIYTTPWCGYCRRAKAVLQSQNLDFDEIDVDNDPKKRAWLMEKTGQHTVPQVFFGEHSVGGCTDLEALVRSGRLQQTLEKYAV